MRCMFSACAMMFFLGVTSSFATTYHVRTDGNDGLDGLSDATAWKTVDKVNGYGFQTGDDVYFKCGGTWTEQQLIVDWSGTAENRVIIGAYHGSGTIGVEGNRPVIQGEMATTRYNGTTGKWEVDDPGYPGDWADLIEVRASYVTITNMTVTESSGNGIGISGYSNLTISHCEMYETWRQALQIVNGSDNVSVEDCEIHHGAKVVALGHRDLGDPPTVTTKNSDSPSFIRCKIYDSYNENIDIDVGTTNALVEYCEIYGGPTLQLYLVNSTDNIVRYNLIYGTANGAALGIYINNESQWSTPALHSNSHIYGNFIANTVYNIYIAGHASRTVNDVFIYNNTFVAGREFDFICNLDTGDGHILKNNIFLIGVKTSAPAGKITADYNLWSQAPDSDLQGAHDPAYADPQLTKTGGWNDLTGGSLAISDFELQSGSPAIDNGVALAASYAVDYYGTARPQGSGWDIGAHEFSTGTGISDFPLPAVHLESEMLRAKDLEIYDMKGALVRITGNVPNGVYIIRLRKAGQPAYKQVSVIK